MKGRRLAEGRGGRRSPTPSRYDPGARSGVVLHVDSDAAIPQFDVNAVHVILDRLNRIAR
ncbi:hypothetical protein [Nostocoides sp. Soil756]|uniref:hypothetical protein n=1 Tax=Nostocoides sp. Soil756 TaxID=1736399 RepID=UPI000ACBD628|nr:hypothetical protein [Tetrasphaera sp. Soil756]